MTAPSALSAGELLPRLMAGARSLHETAVVVIRCAPGEGGLFTVVVAVGGAVLVETVPKTLTAALTSALAKIDSMSTRMRLAVRIGDGNPSGAGGSGG